MAPSTSSYSLRYFAPPSIGGIGDFASLEDEAARLGVSPDELGDQARYSPVMKAG